MSSLVTVLPSSCRSRFSSRTRSENGSRVRLTPLPSSDFRRKKLYFPENEGEVRVDRLLNESGCDWVDMVCSPKRAIEGARGMGAEVKTPGRTESPGRSQKCSTEGMILAATAVRATVAEALRVGKTACHGHHFTAIGAPSVKSECPPRKTRRSARRSPPSRQQSAQQIH